MYLGLSDAEQVEALRPTAVAAARDFGLEVARLEPVAHAYNTTFAVDTSGGDRWALRLGTNSASRPENTVAQQEWLRAIARDTEVLVPAPRRTLEGRWYAELDGPPLDRPVLVTAASWLDGPDVGDVDPVVARALGRTTAELHRHAEGWELPTGGVMPRLVEPLFGDADLLSAADLVPADREVLDRAGEVTAEVFARLHDGAVLRPVHADLHGGNLKWHDGRLAVFDVDDCGLGLPLLDLAVTTFYLRAGDPEPERALLAGYAEVLPLPDVDPADLEAVVAARQLLLANSLLASTTAELRRDARDYLGTTVTRLRHWLGTGTFTRTPPLP